MLRPEEPTPPRPTLAELVAALCERAEHKDGRVSARLLRQALAATEVGAT